MTHHDSITCSNPDTALLALVGRHDALWDEWGEEAPNELVHEACELEVKITAMPAFTSAGFAGKCRVVRRAEFDDDDGIVAAILELDAERVGVGKRTSTTVNGPHATAGG